MSERLRISAVIPTRNRPEDLVNTMASIRRQARVPEEVILIDQSPTNESVLRVAEAMAGEHRIELKHIHDTSVSGLVDAKRVGADLASGDIVCFLEDDVILEPEYLAELEQAFLANPEMVGCSGVITNPPSVSRAYVLAHRLFFRGIFRDARTPVYSRPDELPDGLIQCDVLSGGLSAWRRNVFTRVRFDPLNGFFMFEDMEFAGRVVKAFGRRLFINPRARLFHVGSPVNRDVHGARQRRKLAEAIVFYKKRRDWDGALIGLLSGMVWWLGEASMQALRLRSAGPLRGYFLGIRDGVRRRLVGP